MNGYTYNKSNYASFIFASLQLLQKGTDHNLDQILLMSDDDNTVLKFCENQSNTRVEAIKFVRR